MSEEYDNTNNGAVFEPFPNNDFILEGKLDIEGAEHKLVVIRSTTKGGKVMLKCYTELCAMFENDNMNENAPNYTGNLHERFEIKSGTKLRMAAWKKQHSGNKNYLSLQVSENQKQNEDLHPPVGHSINQTQESLSPSKDPLEDEIPF